MAGNPEIQRRIELLRHELDGAISRYNLRSKIDYWITIILMLIALSASACAGIGGITKQFDSQVTGALALIPGVIALIASTMKFQAKAHWHYRKRDALTGLRRRLLLQLPESPSVDNIAAIANELSEIDRKMSEEWEKHFTFDFSGVSRRPGSD